MEGLIESGRIPDIERGYEQSWGSGCDNWISFNMSKIERRKIRPFNKQESEINHPCRQMTTWHLLELFNRRFYIGSFTTIIRVSGLIKLIFRQIFNKILSFFPAYAKKSVEKDKIFAEYAFLCLRWVSLLQPKLINTFCMTIHEDILEDFPAAGKLSVPPMQWLFVRIEGAKADKWKPNANSSLGSATNLNGLDLWLIWCLPPEVTRSALLSYRKLSSKLSKSFDQ